MIPRRIITAWLNPDPVVPEKIQECLKSQKIPGYEHITLNLRNWGAGVTAQYPRDCLKAKKYAKAVDFIRMAYLYKHGGIWLDADVEMLPGKNFDDLLNNKMFVGQEKNGVFSNAVVGSEADHPLLKEYLRRVEENFKGDGDLVFEPGVRAFADLLWLNDERTNGTLILPPDYFFPYNHETGERKITGNTRCIHYFLKSWK